MTPQDIATYSAGVVALFVVFAIFWRKSQSDKSIDDRVIRQLDERDQTIRELNTRNDELTDRLTQVMKDSIDLARTHGQQIMDAIDEVKQEHAKALTRVYMKLDETERKLMQCEESHAQCSKDMEELKRFVIETVKK